MQNVSYTCDKCKQDITEELVRLEMGAYHRKGPEHQEHYRAIGRTRFELCFPCFEENTKNLKIELNELKNPEEKKIPVESTDDNAKK
ncbi:MAG: hypothetical protein E6R04_11600 [Spirochaetes bacterium]|nr:MAG: hypothetical protein E6R04_11600 [Spirochaetota bacterium]